MMKRWALVVAAGFLAACAAESDSGPGGGGGVCAAGTVTNCSCPDGTLGLMACNFAGTGYNQCACGDAAGGVGALPGDPGAAPAAPGTSPLPGDTGTGASDPTTPLPTDTGMAGAPAPLPDDPATPPVTDPSGGTTGPADPATDPMMEPDPVVVEGDEVPATSYCAEAANWDPAWSAWEEEVLVLVNERRAAGATCGTYGSFGPADPLTMVPELRCSARLHSMDMGMQGYFDHTALDGRDPFDRMADAGYSGGTMGENIAKGQGSPAEVVDGWMGSDGHCRNIMDPGFTEIGIGYWEGPADNPFFNGNRLWTQNFGGPGFGGGGSCPWGPPFC
jgi:uncharacterized protein YkwD